MGKRCYVERLDGQTTGRRQQHKPTARREYIVGQNFTKYEVSSKTYIWFFRVIRVKWKQPEDISGCTEKVDVQHSFS